MKCPHCNKDIFKGQFKCDHCGKIVALAPKKEDAKKEVKEKKKNGK